MPSAEWRKPFGAGVCTPESAQQPRGRGVLIALFRRQGDRGLGHDLLEVPQPKAVTVQMPLGPRGAWAAVCPVRSPREPCGTNHQVTTEKPVPLRPTDAQRGRRPLCWPLPLTGRTE